MPLSPRIFKRLSELLDVAVTRAAIVFPRFNTDGTVSQRTAAEVRTDLSIPSGTLLVDGGALGTPSSGTLTNCTGLPIGGGGTGRTTKLPYTVLGQSASPFVTSAFGGFAYEKITGLVYSSGTNVWASDEWTAPEAGLVEVNFSSACDGFSNLGFALFKNGSQVASLNRAVSGFLIGYCKVVVASSDVLDFRVNSNEASGNIYINSNPNVSFAMSPNY